MGRPAVPLARHLLRVRDLIDRAYAEQLDIRALARSASVSPSYFSRSFKAAFGETPHQYLISRRMERAKAMLRAGEQSITEICLAVGFTSLGSFSSQFRRIVGESPSAYRQRRAHDALAALPSCYVRMWTRPRRPVRRLPATPDQPNPDTTGPGQSGRPVRRLPATPDQPDPDTTGPGPGGR